MRIERTIQEVVELDIDIDVTVEEFFSALIDQESDTRAHALNGLNAFYQFVKDMPDSVIEDIGPDSKKLVKDALLRMAERF